MLKHCIASVSTAALALGLTVSSAFAADKPVYGVLMKTLSNPFWGAMEKGVDEGAKKADVDIFLQAVESDQAAEPQLNACNTMLQEEAGGDDHCCDQFDHPTAVPETSERDENPGRRPRQQPRSGNHQEGGRGHRLPYRLGQRGSGRRRARTISSACSARTPRGRFW